MTNDRRDRHDHGMALILVVLVLTALVAIGTPFVISMKLQERGSVHVVARQEAHLAALSARNHAVAHLFGSHANRERSLVDEDGIPADKYDDWQELQTTFSASLALDDPSVSATDPSTGYAMRGGNAKRTLDATVEDELGKINLNTAMPNLIGNLLAGSHLSEAIDFDQVVTELPLDDTTAFPADDDPDTVDGVVAILNPIFFTVEAVSYRGKTETHLTGCFRGEYLSGTWENQKGWPVFDLRGLKVFLHRYYDLSEGKIDTFRTPQAIREIADWSVIPYFLETVAIFGLDLKNMQEFGLTPEMLLRAGLGDYLDKLDRPEQEVDEEEYRETRRTLLKVGIPAEALDLLEQFRGKAGLIHAGKLAKDFDLNEVKANAFKGIFESTIKSELDRVRKHARGYFPAAIRSYMEIYNKAGLETFTAADFERIRDLVTTTSPIDALWSEEQMVIGEMNTDPILGVPAILLPRYDHFNPGTLVRIRSLLDPKKLEFHLAAGAFPTNMGQRGMGRGSIIQGGLILKDALKFEYVEREAVVSAMLRHPVNINTAPAAVIAAVLTGISTDRFGNQFDSVTAPEARNLADVILENLPISGWDEFRELVHQAATDEIIDPDDVEPILLNAVNPNHPRLSISTTGFCFKSGDVYTIEASGVVRNPAGVELASNRFREVIEIAPPEPLTYELSTQDEWTSWLFRRPATSASQWSRQTTLIPGRTQNFFTTGPVPLNQRDFEAPALDKGALLGLTLDTPEVGGVSAWVEHFFESVEGLDLAQGAFQGDVQDLIRRPLSIDLWVRPLSGGGGVIFDTLADPGQPFESRIRLRVEADTRELVFEMFDDARITQWSRTIYPAAEIRHPLAATEWRPNTWVHLSASWGSTTPGDQVLMIDQRPVGRHSWVSSLAAFIDENAESFVVVKDPDFASRLPSVGTLWVGGEVIEYTQRDGSRFRIGAIGKTGEALSGRGRRGTPRMAHPVGTAVRPFGYSIDVIPSDPKFPAGTMNMAVVGGGGARLEAELLPPKESVTSISGIPGYIPGNNAPSDNPYPKMSWIEVFGGSAFIVPLLPNQTVLTALSQVDPAQLGFPENGYLFVRYLFRPNTAQPADPWYVEQEFIRYKGFVPGSVPQSYSFSLLLRGCFNSTPINSTGPNFLGAGNRQVEVWCVSVESDSQSLSGRYPPSGVVQITPLIGDVEWVLYDWIAEDRFFVADPNWHWRSFRGFAGDIATADVVFNTHAAKLPLVPVLRLLRPGPERGDRVLLAATIDPLNPHQEPAVLPVRKVADGASGVFVGIDRPPTGTYLTNELPRLRRFPTGELPARTSGVMIFGESAETGGGEVLAATIDEVRASQIRGEGDWFAVPVDPDGQPRWTRGSNGLGQIRDLRTDYSDASSVDPRKELDRLRIFPVTRLVQTQNGIGFDASVGSDFAKGRSEGLLALGGEIFLGEESPPNTAGQVILLQDLFDLPRLMRTPPVPPGTVVTVTLREPRREVIPEVKVNTTHGIPPRHGFLEVFSPAGLEVLYYEFASGTSLRNVQRGMFGTVVGHYDWEDRRGFRVMGSYDVDLHARGLLDRAPSGGTVGHVLPLPQFAAARLKGPVDFQIPLSSEQGFSRRDGYIRFDDGDRATVDEIVAFVDRAGPSLILARDDRSGRPIFRERFGSPPRKYPVDTVAIELLARYHDRFEPEAESAAMMRLGRSVTIPGAHWDRITWDVEDDLSGAGGAEVVVIARLDGEQEWDSRPGNKPGSLYLFHEGDDDNRIDRTADQLEFHITHRYRPGSWGLASGGRDWNDEWKRAPVLDRFVIEYRKGWRVVHREDLPF